MEKYKSKTKTNDRAFIIIGFAVILTIFIIYSSISDFSITPNSLQSIERLAIGFYVILLMSFGAIGYGIYRYHQRKVIENDHGVLSIIAKTTMDAKSKKSFLSHSLPMACFFH